ALGEIEQFAANGPPTHHLHKTRDLDLLGLGLRTPAALDQHDGLRRKSYQLQPVSIALLDEREFIPERRRLYLEPLYIVLQLLVVEIDGRDDPLRIEFAHLEDLLRIEPLRELGIGDLIVAVVIDHQHPLVPLKSADVF